jgi:hypothetical protein
MPESPAARRLAPPATGASALSVDPAFDAGLVMVDSAT